MVIGNPSMLLKPKTRSDALTDLPHRTFPPVLLVGRTGGEAAGRFGPSGVDCRVADFGEVLSGALDDQILRSIYIGIAMGDHDVAVLRHVLGKIETEAAEGVNVGIERGATGLIGEAAVADLLSDFPRFVNQGVRHFGQVPCLWITDALSQSATEDRADADSVLSVLPANHDDDVVFAKFMAGAAEARFMEELKGLRRENAAVAERLNATRREMRTFREENKRLRQELGGMRSSRWVRVGIALGARVARAAARAKMAPRLLLGIIFVGALLAAVAFVAVLTVALGSWVAGLLVSFALLGTLLVVVLGAVLGQRALARFTAIAAHLQRLERDVAAARRQSSEGRRRTHRAINRLRRGARGQSERLAELSARHETSLERSDDIARMVNDLARGVDTVAARSVSTEIPQWFRQFEQRYSRGNTVRRQQIEAVINLYAVTDVSAGMPPMGGWAASPDVLLLLVDELLALRPATVVECGSGASTLWLSLIIHQYSLPTRLVALEHDEHYARKTRSLLDRHGVADYADVRYAPLRPLPDDGASWYDIDAIQDVEDVGLLFVDGPPGDSASLARMPAVPQLATSLANDCTIVLDDLVRQEEKRIASTWREFLPDFFYEELPLEKGAAVFRRRASSVHL
jgi:ribosomal 50S subunit-associated protein YjgA (DUF615 family)